MRHILEVRNIYELEIDASGKMEVVNNITERMIKDGQWFPEIDLVREFICCMADLAGSIMLECVPTNREVFHIKGISSENNPNEIVIRKFTTEEKNQFSAGPIDVSFFKTEDLFCPFDAGKFSKKIPLTLEFDALGSPQISPMLLLQLWGPK